MKINRNNYEAYFIDYQEGNLDESLVNEFIQFIRQNPDLKEEMELLNSVTLPVEEMEFAPKNKLYREKYDVEKEFDRAAIAKMEGDLPEKEQVAFEDYLSRHHKKQQEAALFSKTKLEADKSVSYRHKNRLYHRSKSKVVILWASRVAAVVLLAITAYALVDRSTVSLKNQVTIAENESETINKKAAPVTSEEPIAESAEIKNVPDKKSVNKEVKQAEIKTLPPVKIEEAQPKSKSLRDNHRAKIEHEQIAAVRLPVEVPAKLGAISASLPAHSEPVEMGAMNKYVSQPEPLLPAKEERYIADVIKEKTGIDKLSLNKIKKAGLNLVSTISKENFTYETDNEGEITEVIFDSRLLAFSIPTKNEERK